MELLVESLVNGLLIGGLYVTISVGFSLAFGVLDVIDLAVGQWVVIGAYAGVVVQTWTGIDPFALLPAVFVAFASLGWLFAPLIYRVRMSRYALPALMGLALTFGLAMLLRGSLLTVFGYTPRSVHTQLVGGVLSVANLTASWLRLTGFIFAVVAIGTLLVFLYYTRMGLAVRATAQSWEYAGIMGVDVKRVSSLVYAIHAGLTAMAGVIIGAIYSVAPSVGLRYTLFAFFIVVLAGMGSVLGVLAAGLLLGVLQSLTTTYAGGSYTLLVVFGVLFLLLIFFPRGILRRGLA